MTTENTPIANASVLTTTVGRNSKGKVVRVREGRLHFTISVGGNKVHVAHTAKDAFAYAAELVDE